MIWNLIKSTWGGKPSASGTVTAKGSRPRGNIHKPKWVDGVLKFQAERTEPVYWLELDGERRVTVTKSEWDSVGEGDSFSR